MTDRDEKMPVPDVGAGTVRDGTYHVIAHAVNILK